MTGLVDVVEGVDGWPAGYTGPFTINYDCNDGTAHDGSQSVAAGTTSSVIAGIPKGTQCTISETPPGSSGGLFVRDALVLTVIDGDHRGERSDRQRADDQHVDVHRAARDAAEPEGRYYGDKGCDAGRAVASRWWLGADHVFHRCLERGT